MEGYSPKQQEEERIRSDLGKETDRLLNILYENCGGRWIDIGASPETCANLDQGAANGRQLAKEYGFDRFRDIGPNEVVLYDTLR